MINSDIAKSTYTTVPGATEYAIGFGYYWNLDDTPQLFVTLNGEELVYGVGYTISEDNLNVVLAMEPDEPATLIITRNVPFTQTSDYVIGRIDPDQIERDFDLAVMRTQQNKATIDTAVVIVNDCVDEVGELKADVEGTIDDVEQAVRDAEAAAETVAGYETRMTNVENGKVDKSGDTMTGSLRMEGSRLQFTLTGASDGIQIRPTVAGITFSTITSLKDLFTVSQNAVYPVIVGGQSISLGTSDAKWNGVFTTKINNGGDLEVPAVSGTIATKADVDLAANSGTQLRDKGVWYAKMNSATTPPESAEVEGRNYADFTQVDQSDNPIIVIYTYTSGDWEQTETIVPPAAYNGYLPITSKIWDIPEQTGQQGGQVLWSYSAKTFTPYPRIISTDGMAITNSTFSNGSLTNTTTTMPSQPVDATVANKKYVDDAIQSYLPDLFDFKWKDCTMTRAGWKVSNGSWIEKSDAASAYEHLVDDIDGKTLQSETIGSITVQFYLADDGHKICPASEGSNVTAIYNATGVAWYYIIDTENQQLMLPRVNADTQVIKTEVPVDITSNGKAFIFTNGSSTYTFASNANAGFTGSANANTAIGAGVNPANNGAKATGYHSGLSATADLTSATGLYAGNKYLYFYVGA